jgi:hypothetical protein
LQSGFAIKHFGILAAAVGLLGGSFTAKAGDLSLPISGNLLGSVLDAAGTPQMGATVQLFNKYERLIAKTLTNPQGRFAFASLPPDNYSVRVSLSSFLPASRDRVPVKPGLDSVLQIHLATLFSSIEVSYTVPSSAMSDDWKWALRSSPDTRLITRYLPDAAPEERAGGGSHLFSETHAMVSVTGGDSGPLDSESAVSDLGTGFAVSTNVLGRNQLQVAGAYGQSGTVGPAGFGLCAIYSRPDQGMFAAAPEVTMTITQIGGLGPLPSQQLVGSSAGVPFSVAPLRVMSLSTYQTADPLDSVHLEYGMTGETIEYTQHTSRLTPFLRVTVSAGSAGEIIAAYSNGGRPEQLLAHQGTVEVDESPAPDVPQAATNLAQLPQVSERGGELELQRTQNYEVGYGKTSGASRIGVSAFYEDVSNGRLNVAGDLSAFNPTDLFSDGISTVSTYNIGSYRRSGYIASFDRRISDAFDMTVAYGRMGAFAADSGAGLFESSALHQALVDASTANIASVNAKARIPGSHTRILANYGWANGGLIVPWHAFTTQDVYAARGFNIIVRQPLPSPFGMPGRFELTADLRNLLAQGYVPLSANGQTALIVQAPRSLRGGLNFIF